MKYFFFIISLISLFNMSAQNSDSIDEIPYAEIPEYYADYSSGNLVARMIDGLGYRYHWATEGLKHADYDYAPSEDSKSTKSTMNHMLGLSETILNTVQHTPNIRPRNEEMLTMDEVREKALQNLYKASQLIRGLDKEDLDQMEIVFQREDRVSEFPFWNLINGPIADALYHTGQIVAFRRASGNPISSKVNVFMGKNKDFNSKK